MLQFSYCILTKNVVAYSMIKKNKNMNDNQLKRKIVIFDLDGTLALIDKRRDISIKDNGKMDWGKFFDPKNIDLDNPNAPVNQMAKLLLYLKELLYPIHNEVF